MLTRALVAPINHVLRGESWALRRLAAFAGRTACFELPPLRFAFTVCDSGEVAAAAKGAQHDVVCTASAPTAARILAGDVRAYAQVSVAGDADFAQTIEAIVRNARWDVEEDLSRVLGDVLAHRTVSAGRAVLGMPLRAGASLARNLSDYWLEERPLIARRSDVEAWVSEVDTLRDDVERMAQRIQRL